MFIPFFQKSSEKEDFSTTRTEVLWTLFTIEHDLSLNASDHFTKLLPKLCPDSKIARGFRCGRTKTTAILNEALAPDCTQNVVDVLNAQPYSIMVDEATDLGDVKTLLILAPAYNGYVQIFLIKKAHSHLKLEEDILIETSVQICRETHLVVRY